MTTNLSQQQNRSRNIVACIKRVDDIYRNSPTAQLLVSNAPQILQSFNTIKALAMQQEAQLKTLSINRQYDLERFRMVAKDLTQNLRDILNQIHTLQTQVTSYAALANDDPNAKTVIDFTNRQIDQNIAMFNNLTFQLLNA